MVRFRIWTVYGPPLPALFHNIGWSVSVQSEVLRSARRQRHSRSCSLAVHFLPRLPPPKRLTSIQSDIHIDIQADLGWSAKLHKAAAQNVRSGSSPVPTHDPDLRSRPFERIWSRPLEWYNVLVSWCRVQWWLRVIGFPGLQLFTLPSSQATNCCKATLPSCQVSKLHLS